MDGKHVYKSVTRLHIIRVVLWKRCDVLAMIYLIVGMFGGGKFCDFGESSTIRLTKTIQFSSYNK